MEPPQETGKAKGRWDGRIGRETMEYKYLLFDLDGTLTDPREGITTSVQYALKAFGIEEPDREKLTPFIGPPLRGSFRRRKRQWRNTGSGLRQRGFSRMRFTMALRRR